MTDAQRCASGGGEVACPCCGKRMDTDTGATCSFCQAWCPAGEVDRAGDDEPTDPDPWLDELGPIPGTGDRA